MAAAASSTSWLAKLKNEPWFAAVQKEFNSRGIADPLWQSTLAVEDYTLEPGIIITDTNGAQSVGLFQLNKMGVGAGYANSILQDPVNNARLAATKMAARIAADKTGSNDLPTQLRSIELAGWNGSLAQDGARQAALANIGQGDGWPAAITNALGFPQATQDAAKAAGAAALNVLGLPSTTQVSSWLQTALIGSILLAIVAGGFALLAAPQIIDTAKKVAPIAAAAA